MKKTKPIFCTSFTVEISGLPNVVIVACSYGDCAWKAQQYIDSLETRLAHSIISIRRNLFDILV